MLFRAARGYVALCAGVLITTIMSIVIGGVAFVGRLLLGRRNRTNLLNYTAAAWSHLIEWIVYRDMLRVTTTVDAAIAPVDRYDVVIWMGNHPSTLATIPLTRVITDYTPRIIPVAKQNINWILYWVLKQTETAIFIDRENPASWPRILAHEVAKFSHDAPAFLIFPDTHRATPEGIEDDVRKFEQVIPDISTWLTHTRLPKSGGLWTMLSSLHQHRVRLLTFTAAFNVPEWSPMHAPLLCDATLHVRIEEIPMELVPRDCASFQAWLNAEWGRKNQQIARWQHHGELPRFLPMRRWTIQQ